MIYRFGPFTLDSARRELSRDGAEIAVEPQVFDLLRVLIERRDRVVSRDDLLEEVAGEIRAAGGQALVVPTDVADGAAVERLAQAAEARFGREQRVDVRVARQARQARVSAGDCGQLDAIRRRDRREVLGPGDLSKTDEAELHCHRAFSVC